MSHDFLSTYSIKAIEYGIAISFLILFIPFWRFLNGGKAAQMQPSRVEPAVSREASAGEQP